MARLSKLNFKPSCIGIEGLLGHPHPTCCVLGVSAQWWERVVISSLGRNISGMEACVPRASLSDVYVKGGREGGEGRDHVKKQELREELLHC